MAEANDIQIGGDHYKKGGGEEHWDRAYRLKYDPFQYIITKWVERWRDKGGIQDLEKARHAIDKYIEVATAEEALMQARKAGVKVDDSMFICKCGKASLKSMAAISRKDNTTRICAACGVAEALEDRGEEAGPGYVNQD